VANVFLGNLIFFEFRVLVLITEKTLELELMTGYRFLQAR
jgi:hypothetical protein